MLDVALIRKINSAHPDYGGVSLYIMTSLAGKPNKGDRVTLDPPDDEMRNLATRVEVDFVEFIQNNDCPYVHLEKDNTAYSVKDPVQHYSKKVIRYFKAGWKLWMKNPEEAKYQTALAKLWESNAKQPV